MIASQTEYQFFIQTNTQFKIPAGLPEFIIADTSPQVQVIYGFITVLQIKTRKAVLIKPVSNTKKQFAPFGIGI